MNKKEILDKLEEDEHYYGEFGQKFLSNSNISTLLNNPEDLYKPTDKTSAMLIGGYFHTIILEPDKVKNFRVIESSSRNTKKYKEISGGELCLLQEEADKINLMTDKLLSNKFIDYLKGKNDLLSQRILKKVKDDGISGRLALIFFKQFLETSYPSKISHFLTFDDFIKRHESTE